MKPERSLKEDQAAIGVKRMGRKRKEKKALVKKIVAGLVVVAKGKKALAILGLVVVALVGAAVLIPRLFPENKIAIIYLSGVLIAGEESEFHTTTGELWRSFEEAARDGDIKAVVLVVDSPGGTAAACYEMYSIVKRFDKPVVAFARGEMASGSYLVSLGADKTVAHTFSEVGSVGVYIALWEPVPVVPQLPKEIRAITSGKFKDLWADGVLDWDEREFLKLKVEEAKDAFFEIVYERTGIDREKVEAAKEKVEDPLYVFREGGWFIGSKAFELGLVNKLGDIEDALRFASELAGIEYEKAKVIEIDPPAPGTFGSMPCELPLYQDNEALPIYLK